MANVENIQKIIDVLKKDDGTHFRMDDWICYVDSEKDKRIEDIVIPTQYIECGTAFCIGGYANLIRLQEKGKDPKSMTGIDFLSNLFPSTTPQNGWVLMHQLPTNSFLLIDELIIFQRIKEEK